MEDFIKLLHDLKHKEVNIDGKQTSVVIYSDVLSILNKMRKTQAF